METVITSPLEGFETYIVEKLEKNGSRGRPHFLKVLSRDRDARNEALNILKLAWMKSRSLSSIARKYETSYHTIYRFLEDIEPFKEALIDFLERAPSRKIFYNQELDSSDFGTVQAYIKRARRIQLKHYRRVINLARKCWIYLKYKDPARWIAEDVIDFLSSRKDGSQSTYLDAIRKIAPHIADQNSPNYVGTGRYREKLRRRKKDLFSKEVNMIIQALRDQGLAFHEIVFKLHVTLGAREGSRDTQSGITGLSWDRFKDFIKVDLFETKVRGGIWWRDCPIDLLFPNLPRQLWTLWVRRGKPITEKLILGGYQELLQIYKDIRGALKRQYKGRVDPSLSKELMTLKPHDADRIHVNLLWEAEVPLEVVAGKYLGRGEGVGLMGRGWLDINSIKKHYLSLSERSERIRKLRRQVKIYSRRFNGNINPLDFSLYREYSPNRLREPNPQTCPLNLAVQHLPHHRILQVQE